MDITSLQYHFTTMDGVGYHLSCDLLRHLKGCNPCHPSSVGAFKVPSLVKSPQWMSTSSGSTCNHWNHLFSSNLGRHELHSSKQKGDHPHKGSFYSRHLELPKKMSQLNSRQQIVWDFLFHSSGLSLRSSTGDY